MLKLGVNSLGNIRSVKEIFCVSRGSTRAYSNNFDGLDAEIVAFHKRMEDEHNDWARVDIQSSLDIMKKKSLDPTEEKNKGRFYELTTKQILEEYFFDTAFKAVGGSGDKGIDLKAD